MFPLFAADPTRLDPLLLVLAALVLDAVVGDPAAIFRRLPHPVALVGTLIGQLERRFNRQDLSDRDRRLGGIATVVVVVGIAAGVGAMVDRLAAGSAWGAAAEVVVLTVLLAQRSLYDHVAAVARALDREGLAGGREAIRHIVGRDPASLDEDGVGRAAIESLAENFSDGVVAPVFWFLVLGLPGICAYKAVNTLDSMIGHKSDRYRAFGWAAARLDDAANLVPARLAGVLIAIAGALTPRASGWDALVIMARHAPKHRSPNAGWPEAAMAGALDISLAGPRRYGGELVDDPWIGEGSEDAGADDIRCALGLFIVACVVEAALIGLVALLRDGL
ncbi:MAG TPA: adenosylcobinamide-phosphate synthase CbiB [Stellaceae bacterium]|nr:adenosylcobinamide-phosphate synthase CbiB [Stellaceae bacterium]